MPSNRDKGMALALWEVKAEKSRAANRSSVPRCAPETA